jgi:hypothetical protein
MWVAEPSGSEGPRLKWYMHAPFRARVPRTLASISKRLIATNVHHPSNTSARGLRHLLVEDASIFPLRGRPERAEHNHFLIPDLPQLPSTYLTSSNASFSRGTFSLKEILKLNACSETGEPLTGKGACHCAAGLTCWPSSRPPMPEPHSHPPCCQRTFTVAKGQATFSAHQVGH